MSILTPMSQASFSRYWQLAIKSYAEQNIRSGRWFADEAKVRSETEYRRLLPEGLATTNNYLFDILGDSDGLVVGATWVALVEKAGVHGAFIYDIGIDEAYRKQGHGQRAMKEIELFALSLGMKTIGLHVFAFNRIAIDLYESCGYRVTSLNMQKNLTADL